MIFQNVIIKIKKCVAQKNDLHDDSTFYGLITEQSVYTPTDLTKKAWTNGDDVYTDMEFSSTALGIPVNIGYAMPFTESGLTGLRFYTGPKLALTIAGKGEMMGKEYKISDMKDFKYTIEDIIGLHDHYDYVVLSTRGGSVDPDTYVGSYEEQCGQNMAKFIREKMPDKDKSIMDGGIVAFNMDASISFTQINTLAKHYNIDLTKPIKELKKDENNNYLVHF